jgi:phosphoglycerate dehydrogenase-like enzyme
VSAATKPNVAVAITTTLAKQMFRPDDWATLCEAVNVNGPVDAENVTPETMAEMLRDADAVITGWRTPPLTSAMLEASPRLRLLAHSAGSVKFLLSGEMFEKLAVTNAAGANAVPVAEFTVAMIVSLLKQVPWTSAAMARGDDAEVARRKAIVRELQDMTVGLIGASRVGREVIRLLGSYSRLQIKVYDPFLTDEAAAAMGVTKTSLDEACGCEVVSLHAPNLPSTRHMINARTLALMPDHAVFINTSRGALVDEAALVAAVRERPLYVALDVTDPEPPTPDSPLRREPNILLTPHTAGALNQAKLDMGRWAIDETLRFLRGEKLHTPVTRTMFDSEA